MGDKALVATGAVLSDSVGYCPVDFSATTVDEALNRVDLLMYEDKHAYYQAADHDRRIGR